MHSSNKRLCKSDCRVEIDLQEEDNATTPMHDSHSTTGFFPWLLAFFLLGVIAWVSAFTILASHKDIVKGEIYPAFQTPYFPEQKDGARVFTYLGVFYIAAGAFSLLCLSKHILLPTPAFWMVRPRRGLWDYWNALELFAIAWFLAVQAATIISRVIYKFGESPWWNKEHLWYELSKTFGKTAALTLMLLFLPISKSCFWADVLNCKFERAIKYHRLLAWFLVGIVVIHAATAITSLLLVGQFKNCMWPSQVCQRPGGWLDYGSLVYSRIYTYGWLAALVALPLVITSLPWFRRHKFEWFYYTHFLFVPFLVLVHMHYVDMIYYTAPGLAAYVMDKVLWWVCSRRKTRILSLTNPAPGFVRMVIALDQTTHYEPGQWIQIKVPAVSLLQWHPMSVASAPGHSTITLDIKVSGDWTRSLQKLCERFDPTNEALSCVFVDQCLGSSHSQMQGYLTHGAVLMFAGGIGITPVMSALRTLMQDPRSFPNVHRVALVWVVKKKSVIELYKDELARMQQSTGWRSFDILIHVTLSEQEHETEFVTDEEPPSSAVDCTSGASFEPHVMGYLHKLILTVAAGGGYLLGIFLANLLSKDKGWRREYVALLQLWLAILDAASMVAIGMTFSVLWPPHKEQYATSDSSTSRIEEGGSEDLNVVMGSRPDVQAIVDWMKDWCRELDCSSVGVPVCGPDNLVKSVVEACNKSSSGDVQFVVDMETFEW